MKIYANIFLTLTLLLASCASDGVSKAGNTAGKILQGALGGYSSSYYKRISFSEYRGKDEILIGEGGAVKMVNGVEIWKTGTPNKNHRIIGIINQQHLQTNNSASSRARASLESDAANLAKQRGGDAIIEWDHSKKVISYSTRTNVAGDTNGKINITRNGDFYTGQYRGDYSGTGTSVTSPNTKHELSYLVVVYANNTASTPLNNSNSESKKTNNEANGAENEPSKEVLYQETLDLLKEGGDPNSKIHELAYYGHTKALKLLAAEGFNVNLFDSDGQTPLHWAVHRNRFDTAEYLIGMGADVNAKTKYNEQIKANINQSALHYAAFNGDTGMILLLLSNGAEINSPSLIGTPLDVAIGRKQENAISILKKRGGKTSL